MIRVWIETPSAITRAGFESLFEGDQGVEMAGSPPEADVILCEELPDIPARAPVVVLTDDLASARAFRNGVRAVLPRGATPEQIVAALYAAAAGLIVIRAEASSPTTAGGGPEAEFERLTPREMEALEMLAEGLSNKQIAARLKISEHTAKFHVNSILGKLHAGTRTEAVIHGIRSGLLKV
ncbi:MAG: response regulator transcription factor [Acidobacteriota bacterium]|nr:response regulator transcription factor [Acidobacteriota bacterium]